MSHALEIVLRDTINADIPDLGVDLVVCKHWSGYWPGSCQWKPLDYPDSHWIACQTAATKVQRSQMVHVNLLNGLLLVDGWPIGERLLRAVTGHPVYRVIFGDVQTFVALTMTQVADYPLQCNFEVIPFDLPGMDFVTLYMIFEYHVG